MSKLFSQVEFPELFFGFVSPIGTPLEETLERFREFLRCNEYNVIDVKVTDVFPRLADFVAPDADLPLDRSTYFNRIKSHIAYGNRVRDHFDDNSILAGLAIQQIGEKRESSKFGGGRRDKNAYLIHQFKRPEEIELIRSVYGRLFFQVSIYSDRSSREEYISRRIARDRNEGDYRKFESETKELIRQDENEEIEPHGQRVGKIFHDADLILKLDGGVDQLRDQITRFCELLFSSNSITPSRSEHGMFLARSAALRTSDLSRQVGAAIFSPDGNILALGCNEVPRAGGGTYWPEAGTDDDREFRRGEDSNDIRKGELVHELLACVNVDFSKLDGITKQAIERASFMDALEYGRIVHAEMAAITEAARYRGSLQDATLYCTTFPCHMCSKHIVASGIKEVCFLEPYPKSLTNRLHNDSVEIEKLDRGKFNDFPAVKFSHFFGVTPRRYTELFRRGKRKDKSGSFQTYIGGRKKPNLDIKIPFYQDLEKIVFEDVLKRAGEE